METINDRSNQQGENFNDTTVTQGQTISGHNEDNRVPSEGRIDDDFLANGDENDQSSDTGTETDSGASSQEFEKQDYTANDRGGMDADDVSESDSPGTL